MLQLVTALHFALVPHGFSAGLNGFVHVHAARGEEPAPRFDRAAALHGGPSLVSGAAPCASESCPIGFSGPHSLLVAPALEARWLALAVVAQSVPLAPVGVGRSRVLLSAPKTSPPIQV